MEPVAVFAEVPEDGGGASMLGVLGAGFIGALIGSICGRAIYDRIFGPPPELAAQLAHACNLKHFSEYALNYSCRCARPLTREQVEAYRLTRRELPGLTVAQAVELKQIGLSMNLSEKEVLTIVRNAEMYRERTQRALLDGLLPPAPVAAPMSQPPVANVVRIVPQSIPQPLIPQKAQPDAPVVAMATGYKKELAEVAVDPNGYTDINDDSEVDLGN